jgi:hypothetical protein
LTRDGQFIVLSGFAHDDQTFAGDLAVSFTGLYEGSITCQPDGYFSLQIDRPITSGYIYATAFDGELVSIELPVYFSID